MSLLNNHERRFVQEYLEVLLYRCRHEDCRHEGVLILIIFQPLIFGDTSILELYSAVHISFTLFKKSESRLNPQGTRKIIAPVLHVVNNSSSLGPARPRDKAQTSQLTLYSDRDFGENAKDNPGRPVKTPSRTCNAGEKKTVRRRPAASRAS